MLKDYSRAVKKKLSRRNPWRKLLRDASLFAAVALFSCLWKRGRRIFSNLVRNHRSKLLFGIYILSELRRWFIFKRRVKRINRSILVSRTVDMKGAHVPFLRQLLSHYRGQDDLVVKNVRGWFQGRPLEEIHERLSWQPCAIFSPCTTGHGKRQFGKNQKRFWPSGKALFPNWESWIRRIHGCQQWKAGAESRAQGEALFILYMPSSSRCPCVQGYHYIDGHASMLLCILQGLKGGSRRAALFFGHEGARVRLSSCSTASDLERRHTSDTFWRTLGRKGGQSYSQNFRTFPLAHFANTFQAQTRQPLSCTDMPERSLINELYKSTTLRTVLGPQFLRTGFAAIQRTFAREFTSILCVWENAGA